MTNQYNTEYQPDVLEVISNLSNDAVFTPPKVANAVLDLLPDHVWSNSKLRWLDPGSKTGIFPREITKRLMEGLKEEIPEDQSRLEHILRNMIYAIATEDVTSMISRRSLYCSKDASGDYSVVKFANSSGNVWHKRTEHSFVSGRCSVCQGAEDQLEIESRDNKAYPFIHPNGKEQFLKETPVNFDVIIGNPPYQMESDSEGKNVSSLYDLFVDHAMKLNPQYIAMIIPSRWMAGGRGLDEFRDLMLKNGKIRALVDYPDAGELFPSVEIKGGVCYFLWDRDNPGTCETTTHRNNQTFGPVQRKLDEFEIFVRDSRALPILHKVLAKKEAAFSEIVSTRDPFGPVLSSNFDGYRKNDNQKPGDLKLHMVIGGTRVEKWVDPETVTRNHDLITKWKLLVPKAYGASEAIPHQIIGQSIVAGPRSVCSPTYLVAGPFKSKTETESADSYLRTKFARFIISLSKISQNSTAKNYLWVPQQQWDRTWSDTELYKKYGLTKAEQEYIEQMIKEM